VIEQQERMRLLVKAGIGISSELSLDAVLQRLVEAAATLTEASYAALGVIDQRGRGLERFLTTGVSEEQIREIGDFPVGRGILGALIRDAEPLRLHDLSTDPRSVGFPPGHPPMKTFLGVPVVLRGVSYGNLYLTEKAAGEDFTEEDEEIVQLLGAQAAVAIDNARLYESATRRLRRLESMTEVGNALARETDLPVVLELVATRLRELIGARLVFIALPTAEGDLRVEAAADHENVSTAIGIHLSRDRSKTGRVLERGWPERVDSLIDDPEVDRDVLRRFAELTALPVPSTGLFLPLIAQREAFGVICAHDMIEGGEHDLRFSDEDLRVAEWFAQRAAIAVDLSRRIQRDAMRHIVGAQELERKRLARELHDETGQALTSILLGLKTLEEAKSLEGLRAAVAEIRETTVQTLQDVRRLAVELRPTVLDDFGLVPALERLVEGFRDQTGLDVQLEARIGDRLPGETETALYRIVQESLTNVIKHARARQVSIVLAPKGTTAAVVIEDDGRGFSPDEVRGEGLGLLGMRERLGLIEGTLTIETAPGGGTTLVAEVPIS
jgi:signal transduction histidine kinase